MKFLIIILTFCLFDIFIKAEFECYVCTANQPECKNLNLTVVKKMVCKVRQCSTVFIMIRDKESTFYAIARGCINHIKCQEKEMNAGYRCRLDRCDSHLCNNVKYNDKLIEKLLFSKKNGLRSSFFIIFINIITLFLVNKCVF